VEQTTLELGVHAELAKVPAEHVEQAEQADAPSADQ
jgi:hypothetical protein